MPSSTSPRASTWSTDRVRLLHIAALVWLGFGAVHVAQSYLLAIAAGRDWSLTGVLLSVLPWWFSWLACTPVIAWLADRYPISGTRPWQPLVRHALAAIFIVCVQLIVTGSIQWLTTGQFAGPATSLGNQVQRYFGSFFMESLVTYAGIAGVLIAIDVARAMRDETLARSRLQEQAALLEATAHKARLDALAMELNPHFLFNTLSTVAGLIAQDRRTEARDVIQRLGGLLRQSLGNGNGASHTVGQEVELLEDYLQIQRTRFGDRLRVAVALDDSVHDCQVPLMLVQPLVENAVRHGAEPREGEVEVRITIQARDDSLWIAVADSGRGFVFGPDGALPHEGIGISNTRERLARLFGDSGMLALRNRPGGGAEVLVRLPLVRSGAVVEPVGAPA
jgi:signal transduction histidine kinase